MDVFLKLITPEYDDIEGIPYIRPFTEVRLAFSMWLHCPVATNSHTKPRILLADGKKASTHEQQIKRWQQHFKVLKCRKPGTVHSFEESEEECPTLDVSVDPIHAGEVTKASQSLKNGKAALISHIQPKYSTAVIPELADLYSDIWKSRKIASEWKNGIVIPLPKKGNCSNVGGVLLCCQYQTVFSCILLGRI